MNHTNNILLAQYTKLQKIGSGLTSIVYKATHQDLGEVCLKVIDHKFYSKPVGKLLIDNQVFLLKSFDHKNLLKLKKYQRNQKENIIVTDYCDGGNLYDLTKKCKKFTEKQTLIIAEGIINGLSYLYSKKIIHRDLKPQNIFFKKGQPIVADFGFAVNLDNKTLNKVNAGSPLYMAPQTLQNLDFSMDSQVFAIGVIIYEMLKGKTPWSALSEKQLLKNMLVNKPSIDLTDKKFQNLIKKCLEPKRQKRAKFEEILSFFNEWKDQYFKESTLLNDVKNVKKANEQAKQRLKTKEDSKEKRKTREQKEKKKTKVFKLSIKPQGAGKENTLNNSLSDIKTNRTSEFSSHYRTKSITLEADGAKTKRNKIENCDNDLRTILKRLDPEQMRFLPSSMIEKFKFILLCYQKIIEAKQLPLVKDIPKELTYDKLTVQISKCKGEKELCRSIGGYIGRMYRLAKNYKIYEQFIKDIEVLNKRVQGFCF